MHTAPLVISAIAAMGENRVIGDDNELPWYLPADLQHFKNLTSGHPILMGRKTYESIGRPLPKRTNFILTRNPNFQAEGCILVRSMEEAIEKASAMPSKELFIIGGAEVYQQTLDFVSRIYLTIVHDQFEGDTYFPILAEGEWQQISSESHEEDEDNEYAYSFLVLERVS
jgi:dihydrofolate reductase